MTFKRAAGLAIWALLAGAGRLLAADGGEAGGYWPQFHGPGRDNISTEKGLLHEWPEGGPKLVWRFTECGEGYSGVAIVGGKIFTVGDFGEKEILIALDLDGKVLWKTPNGESWRREQPGCRTTPTFSDGVLYHMGPTGRLAAVQAASGKEVWAVDLKAEFDVKYGTWAMAENILIDGKTLFCTPGGSKGRIVALDKATGGRIWVNTEIADGPAYCSPAIAEGGGGRQLVTLMQKSVVAVDAATGKLLWTHRHETKNDQNVTMPIFKDGHVFASSGHGTGGRLLKIGPDGAGAAEVWLNKDLDNCHGGVILVEGRLYGSGCRLFGKGLVCADFAGGKTLWNEKSLGKLSLTYADGMLYGLSDKGKMSLVEAGRQGCRIESQFDVPREKGGLWLAHPVVCGGRLYVRHNGDLFAYDVRASARPPGA
jgi:outer membrane protein assembly factor BamB